MREREVDLLTALGNWQKDLMRGLNEWERAFAEWQKMHEVTQRNNAILNERVVILSQQVQRVAGQVERVSCLLYTTDAADEGVGVDLGVGGSIDKTRSEGRSRAGKYTRREWKTMA
ncbi:MbeD family mobilization/exclusion protein, partial [Salmonella enterica]|uniref:MbeD family mobilization/exclusion protein n=1 Tax=Salmonella enterica TaxID=28901 RepID=UPI00398C2840